MEVFLISLFAIAAFILIYTYIGYGALLWVWRKWWMPVTRKSQFVARGVPTVAHVIAAYNEQDFIHDKIWNCLQLRYAPGKLSTYFITDGSTDRTTDIISEYPEVHLFHRAERNGKLAAIRRILPSVKEDIIVFSDANSILNTKAVQQLVSHFQDMTVGAVAGEKVVSSSSEENVAEGEGAYWKYESFLKTLDSDFHTVVGAAGELFAVRKELLELPPSDTLIEDFVISMKVVEQGYRVVYEPQARACETGSANLHEEQKRKVRIAAGGLQASWRLRHLLNPFRYRRAAFQLLSHRTLRWTLAPLALVIALVSSAMLAMMGSQFFIVAFGAQTSFYLAALIGYQLDRRGIKLKLLFIPYYFTFMNLCVFQGLGFLLRGSAQVTWEKAARLQHA